MTNIERKRSKPIWKETPFLVGLTLTFVVLGVFSYALFCLPVNTKEFSEFTKWEYLKLATPNEIGDTLAGVAGSLAFVWLVVTVWLQASELREQRIEFEEMNSTMAAQLFETTFFEIISTFNQIVNSIDLYNVQTSKETKGRDCFSIFYTRFNKAFRKLQKQGNPKALDVAYFTFWKDHQSELGHYFRFLYRAFVMLSESPYAKEYHWKLLRSQLSDQELLLLFYNSLSAQGRPFQDLAIKFELFDNLPTIKLLENEHMNLVDRASFGKNPMKTEKNIRIQ